MTRKKKKKRQGIYPNNILRLRQTEVIKAWGVFTGDWCKSQWTQKFTYQYIYIYPHNANK